MKNNTSYIYFFSVTSMTVPGTGVAAVPGTDYSYASPYTQYSTTAYGAYGYTTSSIVGKYITLLFSSFFYSFKNVIYINAIKFDMYSKYNLKFKI